MSARTASAVPRAFPPRPFAKASATASIAACLTALALAAAFGTGPARAAGEGWAEVGAGSSADDGLAWSQVPGSGVGPNGPGVGRDGDRLWMVRPGDSIESVALRTTGSVAASDAIARYNGLAREAALEPGRLLYVPSALLAPTPDAAAGARWEITEFDGAGRTPHAESETRAARAPAVRPIERVSRENLDLFAGQVEVLGEVSVSRVAVGDGAIVRAEVLGSGELLVIAQAPGSSSLRLWHADGSQSDYNIRVSETDPETRVRMERMVRMRVRMVEFRKSALGRLGVNWTDEIAGPGFATAGDAIGNDLFRPASPELGALPTTVEPFSTYFGIATNITSRINLFASNGDARTLAEPVLTATNGGSASFLAGGEVPYPSVGTNGQTIVQFKEYGIKLDVSPAIDSAGNVRTLVETEISQLDPAVSVAGAPGLLTRRAQTQVNVRSGETIVISGLLSSESSTDVDKVPGIGNLPIIGNFFRSRSRRSAVTELVIFVTPEVIEPEGSALATRERRVLERSNRAIAEARSSLAILD